MSKSTYKRNKKKHVPMTKKALKDVMATCCHLKKFCADSDMEVNYKNFCKYIVDLWEAKECDAMRDELWKENEENIINLFVDSDELSFWEYLRKHGFLNQYYSDQFRYLAFINPLTPEVKDKVRSLTSGAERMRFMLEQDSNVRGRFLCACKVLNIECEPELKS